MTWQIVCPARFGGCTVAKGRHCPWQRDDSTMCIVMMSTTHRSVEVRYWILSQFPYVNWLKKCIIDFTIESIPYFSLTNFFFILSCTHSRKFHLFSKVCPFSPAALFVCLVLIWQGVANLWGTKIFWKNGRGWWGYAGDQSRRSWRYDSFFP